MSTQTQTKLSVKEMSYIGIFTAAMVVSGFIQIPLPFTPVPITLQTMMVILAGLLLNKRDAALSLTVYLLLGAIGLPVFAGGHGGLSVIVGPTGGYLVSWVLAAWLVAVIRGKDFNLGRVVLASLIGGVWVVYAIGVPWLALATGMGLSKAIAAGALPFIPGDLFKVVLAVSLGLALHKHVKY